MKFPKVRLPHIANPIRAFAVLCVAVTSAYVMFIGWTLITILRSPDWCARALGAEKASPGQTIKGLEACIELMGIQLNALAMDSHISQGVIAMCLLTLMVIVIAGGKLKGSGFGGSLDIGADDDHDPAVAGAKHVEEAAHQAAAEVGAGIVEPKPVTTPGELP